MDELSFKNVAPGPAAADKAPDQAVSGQSGPAPEAASQPGTGQDGQAAAASGKTEAVQQDQPASLFSTSAQPAPAGGGENSPAAPGAGQGEAGQEAGQPDAASLEKAWTDFAASAAADYGIAPETLKGFSGLAQELKLPVEGAKKLMDWSREAALREREARVSRGRQELMSEWAGSYQANIDKATAVVALLDRQLGDNRFKKALEASGVCADPDFARGLKYIAEQLQEDALGLKASDAGPQQEESPLDALKGMFK